MATDVHSFKTKHAEEYGIIEAILLWNFNHWLDHNKANETNFHDGTYWTYNSVAAFKKLYPYISQSKIRRALKHLEDEGIIITGNYNKVKFDRTTWYAFTEKGWGLFGESILQDEDIHLLKMTNGSEQNDEPIPDSNHIHKPNKKTDSRFTPPDIEEVKAYIKEKGYSINAERWMAYYESNGWMVGRNKMKDWKASVRYWNSQNKGAEDEYISEYDDLF